MVKSYGLDFTVRGAGLRISFPVRPADNLPSWEFNGDYDKPTFRPSILMTTTYNGKDVCCHSFVTNGKIQFLSDCNHELAGQTIELPDLET